jgi:hypothetical protein
VAFHGEAGAEQAHALEPELGRGVGGRFDNAEQGDRGGAAQPLEDNVRGVGGEDADIRAGPCQPPELLEQISRELVQPPRLDERQQAGEVDAVDDDGRVAAVRPLLAIGGDDRAVVIDGRGRRDPADDAECPDVARGGRHSRRVQAVARSRSTASCWKRRLYSAAISATAWRAAASPARNRVSTSARSRSTVPPPPCH